MGAYIVTQTKSNMVFYTNSKSAFFVCAGITYQIVYVDQGRNGHRFASLRKMIKLIESGKITCLEELASAMKRDVTWQHSQRKPWLESPVVV